MQALRILRDPPSYDMFVKCLGSLTSPVLEPCLPEIITRMHVEDLEGRVGSLLAKLKAGQCVRQQKASYGFLRKMVHRVDATDYLTEETLRMVVKAMLKAEQDGCTDIEVCTTRLLYDMVVIYGEEVMYEILDSLQGDTSRLTISALRALALIIGHPKMPIRCMDVLLSRINSMMNMANTMNTQKYLCHVIRNCVIVLSTHSAKKTQSHVHLLLQKTGNFLRTWISRDTERMFIIHVLKDIEFFLQGYDLSHRNILYALCKEPQIDCQSLLTNPEEHQKLIKDLVEESIGSGTWLELYNCMKRLLNTSIPYNKQTAVLYVREILANTMELSNKEHSYLIATMSDLLAEDDATNLSAVLDCIKMSVEQNPELTSELQNELTSALMQQIKCSNGNVKVMNTTLAAMELLRGKHEDKLINAFLELLFRYVDSSDLEIQLSAITLIGVIVQKCRLYPFSPIANVLKENLTLLLLKVHSQDPGISPSAETALNKCLPHLCRWYNVMTLPCWRSQQSSMTFPERLDSIYRILQKNNLLKPVLIYCIKILPEINDMDLFTYIKRLRDKIPYSELLPTDLSSLHGDLQKVLNHSDGLIRNTAYFISMILGEKWKSLGIPNRSIYEHDIGPWLKKN